MGVIYFTVCYTLITIAVVTIHGVMIYSTILPTNTWDARSINLHLSQHKHCKQLTQSLGTRVDKLTCRGANRCSCCRQEVASAWTSGSWWSCIIAQAHRNELRVMHTDAVFPEHIQVNKLFSLIDNNCLWVNK